MGFPTTVGRRPSCVKTKSIYQVGFLKLIWYIPKPIQDTQLKNKESVYGVPHDRGAQAILRKNKINIPNRLFEADLVY